MIFRIRNAVLILVIFLISWIAWHIHGYFFDISKPEVALIGICDNEYYSGDIQCAVSGKHRYKIADVSISLDNKSIINKFRINKGSFTHPFPISSKTLSDGKHVLKAEVTDGTKNKNVSLQECVFNIDNIPLQAAFVRPGQQYIIPQGNTFHIQFQSNKQIKKAQIQTLSKVFNCYPETNNRSLIYESFIPISCEETPNEYPFTIEIEDHVNNRINLEGKFQVIPYQFKQRKILQVNKDKIAAEKNIGDSQALLEEKLSELVKKSEQKKLWCGLFIIPVAQTGFSCPFGEIRTTQEKGRYIHTGLDVIAAPKSVVWAPQDGIIVLKDRFEFSGNTVVIDHGLGIFSLFFHLDNFAPINVGSTIKKGNPIGSVGKTGYATGYHLHWEMRISNIPVEPLQWTRFDF